MCVVKAIALLYILTTGKRSTFTQTTKPVTKIITYVTYERSKMRRLMKTWPPKITAVKMVRATSKLKTVI